MVCLNWRVPGLIAVLLLTCFLISPGVNASTLNELQNEKELLEKKKVEINGKIHQSESELILNDMTLDAIQTEIQKMNDNLKETSESVNRSVSEIIQTEEEIELLYNAITDLENDISVRDLILRNRIRAIQVNNGTIDFIDVILGSTSLIDLIDRAITVSTLLEADRKLIKQQTFDVQELEEVRMYVSQILNKQRNIKDSLEEQKELLESQKNDKDQLVLELENKQQIINADKSNLLIAYGEAIDKSNEVSEEIVALQKRQISLNKQNVYTTYTSSAACSPGKTIEEGLYLEKFNSAGVFTGKGQEFINIANEYNIDPVLMTAITFHETGSGKSLAVTNYNNPGGLMNPETNWSTLIRFDTLEDGLRSTGRTLNRLINKGGLLSISDLGSAYAPIGADNDPTGLNAHWVPNVTKFVNEFGGLTQNCKNT